MEICPDWFDVKQSCKILRCLMKRWLYDILRDGTVVDNQQYQVSNGFVRNHRFHTPIELERAKRRTQPRHHEELIWQFLNKTKMRIDRVMREDPNALLVLFDTGEYEHNTTDDFIDVSGVDCLNFKLDTGNLIGYIKEGSYSLKISSRFGERFLKYIISDADGFVDVKDAGGQSLGEGFEWLLIYLWSIKLKKAFRLGLPKVYMSKDDRQYGVKGQIDVSDYFLNKKLGQYRCSYREHSYNNIQASLILEAFHKVNGHAFVSDMHSIKNTFLTAVGANKLKYPDLIAASHFSNPFYSDYNNVIDLSKLIVKDEFDDFGSKSDTNAFLFDVSMLFEYYVRKILKRNGFCLLDKFNEPKKIPTGVHGNYMRKLEPDLVLEWGSGVVILDVKYKNYDFKFGVKREDLFQLHTYVGQYGNSESVKGCGFVYPIAAKKWSEVAIDFSMPMILDEVEIMGRNLAFGVFFLVIPDERSDNYQKEFYTSVEKMIKCIERAYR